jgi:RNase P/RNase MRP subunit POP5
MLNRRPKRRYVCLVQAGEPADSSISIKKRFSELFGTIATERAAIRLIEQRGNESIIKCTLEQLENVLLSIALLDPPAVTIRVSGSIKHLRKRGQLFLPRQKTRLL